MKKLVITILVIAFFATSITLGVVYVKKYACKDVNRALESYYDDNGIETKWYMTDWDGNRYVEGS